MPTPPAELRRPRARRPAHRAIAAWRARRRTATDAHASQLHLPLRVLEAGAPPARRAASGPHRFARSRTRLENGRQDDADQRGQRDAQPRSIGCLIDRSVTHQICSPTQSSKGLAEAEIELPGCVDTLATIEREPDVDARPPIGRNSAGPGRRQTAPGPRRWGTQCRRRFRHPRTAPPRNCCASACAARCCLRRPAATQRLCPGQGARPFGRPIPRIEPPPPA